MSHLFRIVTVLILFSGFAVEAKSTWKEKINRNGIKVYQQHLHPQYKYFHTKGVMTIKAKPAAVIALMKDLKTCEHWVFSCLSATYLTTQNKKGSTVHMTFEGPLWLKDRDVVFSIETEQLADEQWLMKIKNQSALFPNNKFVRIQETEASWLLTPVANGELLVTYEIYMDPQTSFKAGVNKYNRDATYNTLLNMQKMLQQAPFNQIQDVPEG
ncbi:MAG: hypothetical protein ACSHWU_07230 [Marinicella sp.]